MLLELDNELYSIRHYEPSVMVQGVNYGDGYYHQYDVFDKTNNIFTNIDVSF